MYCFKRFVVALLWIIVVIDGNKWYSATIIESDSPSDSTKLFQSNHTHDSEHNFAPRIGVNHKKQLERNKWRIMKANITSFELQKASVLDKNINNFKPNVTESTASNVRKGHNENSNLGSSRSVFKYKNTIHNVNIIKRIRPKRKIILKKCPVIRRQKKQLLKQSPKTKFLEIFEVVEFNHVACISSSGLEGICLPEQHCQTSGGTAMGTCADGYGTCCVTQFSCDDQSAAPQGWFTNPGFPSPSTDRLSCAFTLEKAAGDVKQIRLDFVNFELLPPTAGTCEQDQFVVSGQNVNNIIPILCGVNTGQHVYIEVGDVQGLITLSVQTVTPDSRLFSIKVTQIKPEDDLAAPPGCLQYLKEPLGFLESFNYRDKSDIAIARSPSYLNNLNYAMCIERVPEACSVTYSNAGYLQIVNYDADGLPVIPPGQAGVEVFNCPTDWLLVAAVRLCGDRLNDGSVLQDFALDAPVTDIGAGPTVVWFRSDGGYVGRGFKLQYQQNNC